MSEPSDQPRSDDPDRLAVSEIFMSLQGEGPSTGERAIFVRLAECNLACVWCDTAYSWDWTRHERALEVTSHDPTALAEHLIEITDDRLRLLVLTGGEPMLQQTPIACALIHLRTHRPEIRCEVETNGTVLPRPDMVAQVSRFVVSPKLAHAGGRRQARIRPNVLHTYAAITSTAFKFVVASAKDIAEINEVIGECGISPHQVWLMPLAAEPAELLDRTPAVADLAVASGCNFSGRAHILQWGSARGH